MKLERITGFVLRELVPAVAVGATASALLFWYELRGERAHVRAAHDRILELERELLRLREETRFIAGRGRINNADDFDTKTRFDEIMKRWAA